MLVKCGVDDLRIISMFYQWFILWLIGVSCLQAQEKWVYLDNGKVRVGINLHAGASVGWLSKSKSAENLLNSFDHGRYVQQSFYGDVDGSDWNGKPWRYNPVQGGSWKGVPAELLEHRETAIESYAKTRPRQWASGVLVQDMMMEQWLKLEGDQVHLRYRMHYSGKVSHKARHQEMPAVFVNARYDTLVFCEKNTGEVVRKQPGPSNEYFHTKEPWLAWVDATQEGVGVFFPGTDFLTAYRVRNGNKGDVSYAAPLRTLALTPGYELEYQAVLVLGKWDEMRQAFASLSKIQPH
jgi:hypothetical protein